MTAYESICFLSSFISTVHYPNAIVVASKLSCGNPDVWQQMYDYCLSCAQPAFEYFKAKFHSDLQIQLNGFKATRLFDPVKVCELQPTGVDIDDLKVFSFFAPLILEGLKVELPVYLAKANGVSADYNGGKYT